MTDPHLPPELRHRHDILPPAILLELPIDNEITPPPVRKPDRVAEEHNPEPFLRRS